MCNNAYGRLASAWLISIRHHCVYMCVDIYISPIRQDQCLSLLSVTMESLLALVNSSPEVLEKEHRVGHHTNDVQQMVCKYLSPYPCRMSKA